MAFGGARRKQVSSPTFVIEEELPTFETAAVVEIKCDGANAQKGDTTASALSESSPPPTDDATPASAHVDNDTNNNPSRPRVRFFREVAVRGSTLKTSATAWLIIIVAALLITLLLSIETGVDMRHGKKAATVLSAK